MSCGGLAFEASTRVPFDASVIYYGRNPRNINDIAKIKGAILAIYASEDPAINQGIPDLIKAVLTHKPRFEMAFYPARTTPSPRRAGPHTMRWLRKMPGRGRLISSGSTWVDEHGR